jgi:hypothetical protein
MGLKDVMKYLQQRDPDTPDTSQKITGYQREASFYAGCTPDTPDTSRFGDAQESVQLGPVDEASNDPEPPTAKPSPTTRQSYQEWVQTWQPLADAYHAHHFACPTCISAAKGYSLRCGAGAAVWTAYDQAEPSQAKVLARAPIAISTSSSTSTSKDSPEASA